MKVITSEILLIKALTTLLKRDGRFRILFNGRRQTKEICIGRNHILFATSNLLKDKLTEILFKAGKLTREQYMLATELSIVTKKRTGDILIHEGFLSKKDVEKGLRDQAIMIICSLFEHPDWKMNVSEFTPDRSMETTPKLSLFDALITGIRSVDNLSVLYEALPRKEEILEIYPGYEALADRIRMTQDESLLFSLADGRRTLQEIYQESKMWEYRFYKTLYPLLALKILKAQNKPFELSLIEEAAVTAASDAGDPEESKVQTPSAGSPSTPVTFENQMEEAKFLISTEQYSAAANKLRSLIGTDSRKPAYYYYLGLALDHIPGQNKEAEKMLKMAIRLENYNPRYYLALGYLYLNRNMTRQAREQFMTAFKWDPQDPYVQEAIEYLNRIEKKGAGFLTERFFRKKA